MTSCPTDHRRYRLRGARPGGPAAALAAVLLLFTPPGAAGAQTAAAGQRARAEQGPAQPGALEQAAEPAPAGPPAREILLSPLVESGDIALPPVGPEKAPVDAAGDGAQEAPPQDERAAPVAREGLGGPDPAAIGLGQVLGDGLGPGLWAGSDRARVTTLFRALDRGSVPEPMKGLARRLMLAPAAPPPVAGGDPVALLAARFGALARAGLAHDLAELGALRGADVQDGDVLYPLVHAQLIEGAFGEACALARKADARSHEQRWLPILLFCAAENGDRGALDLTIGLYSEVFGEDALAILALRVAALRAEQAGAGAPPPAGSYRSVSDPVVTAVAATLAGDSPPVAFAARAGGLALAALLRHDGLEPDARIVTAVRGYEAGLLDAATLAQVLVAYPFPPGARDGLLQSPAPPEDAPLELRSLTRARRLAAMVQWLAEAAEGPVLLDRVAQLAARLSASEFLGAAPLIALPLSALAPKAVDASHAAAVIDVLLASGRIATARQWWQAASGSDGGQDTPAAAAEEEDGAPADPPAGAAGAGDAPPALDEADRLQPAAAPQGRCPGEPRLALRALLFALAPLAESGGEEDGLLRCVDQALAALEPPPGRAVLDTAAVLSAALGRKALARRLLLPALAGLAQEPQRSAEDRVHAAPATVWAVLADAVAHQRRGEALLAAAVLAGRADGPAARSAVVSALENLGLDEAARGLAVRSLLARLHQAGL